MSSDTSASALSFRESACLCRSHTLDSSSQAAAVSPGLAGMTEHSALHGAWDWTWSSKRICSMPQRERQAARVIRVLLVLNTEQSPWNCTLPVRRSHGRSQLCIGSTRPRSALLLKPASGLPNDHVLFLRKTITDPEKHFKLGLKSCDWLWWMKLFLWLKAQRPQALSPLSSCKAD